MNLLSIIPPLAAILGAAATKRIIPALVTGLLAGTFIKAKSLLGGFILAGDYLSGVIADRTNAYILLFLFCFGALAEIFKAGGGISGLAKKAEPYVKDEKAALLSVWAATPITFLDCCFHAISTGTISKPLVKKVDGSLDKLAFIINTTSSQLIVLIPFATTYVGYILGVLTSAMARAGIKGSPYMFYLQGIYLNFYSLLMVAFSFLIIYFNFNFKFLRVPEPAFKITEEETPHHVHEGHEESEFDEKVPPRAFNLYLPLLTLLGLITFFFWQTGHKGGRSFWQSLLNADFEKAIFLATLITLVATAVFYSLQRISMDKIQSSFLAGGTELLPPIVVLILAWSISAVTEDLGFKAFISGLIGPNFPPQIIPLIVFLIGGLASYFMGSSWGTWALMLPLSLSLAVTTGANLPLTLGAILAGGSIGDNLSPLGETPVLTSSVIGIPITKHISYVLPFGLAAIALSGLIYLVAGILVK